MKYIIFFILLHSSLYAEAAFKVPVLKDYVNDEAGIISANIQNELNEGLANIVAKGGAHIVVLTIPSLQGVSIEQASIQIVDQWKIGDVKKDNGVLLLVAKDERQIRIEVGQGLEGELTDAYAKRIISEVMVPLFRAGNISEGILLGAFQIAQVTNPTMDIENMFGQTGHHWQSTQKQGWADKLELLFLLFFLFIFIMNIGFRGSRRRTNSIGTGWGNPGGSSWGRSSGYRGGGGGFSGGGASGGW